MYPQKTDCHFSYRLRGNGAKLTKWAVKHKTEFGIFIIQLRKQLSK